MTLTEMRRFAEIAQDEGVPLEMNPADVLALLAEVERLRAKLSQARYDGNQLRLALSQAHATAEGRER